MKAASGPRGVRRLAWLIAGVTCLAASAQTPVPGRIAGRVLDSAGDPLAGATVTLRTPTGAALTASSGPEGRFAFGGLARGVFTLSAALEGHVETQYGSMAPGDPGTPIRLTDGQALVDVDLVLPAAGAISGTIRNAAGQPANAGVRVFAVDWDHYEYRLRPAGGSDTDEHGMFRVSDLPPDSYLVSAQEIIDVRAALERRLFDARLSTWHPGVPTARSAAPVVVTPGREVRGLDVTLGDDDSAPMVVVVRSTGEPIADVNVAMWQPSPAGPVQVFAPARFSSPDSSHMPFRLADVAAGRYDYLVSAAVADRRWWGSGVVTTDGVSPTQVEVFLSPPASLTGRVVFDEDTEDRVFPGIRLTPVDAEPVPPRVRRIVTVPFTGGGFEMLDVPPGRYVVETEASTPIDARYALQSLRIAGQDVTDLPFDVSAGQMLGGIEITLSARQSTLEGHVIDESDRPLTAVTLVAFPADAGYRWPGSRRIQTTRPDTTGAFAFVGLPAGEYLVASVPARVPAALRDMRYLTELAAEATPATVVVDGATSVLVRVGDPGSAGTR